MIDMKILLLAGQFYPDLAGSGIATHMIANKLAQRGYDVTVCVDVSNSYLRTVNGSPRFKIKFINNYKAFMTGQSSFQNPTKEIYNVIKEGNYDVIHVFSYLPMLLLTQIKKLVKPPIIFTFWNAPDMGRRSIGFYESSKLDLQLAGYIIQSECYEEMILGSEVSYKSVLDLGGSLEKTSFCYHGIDVKDFERCLLLNDDIISKYFHNIHSDKIILLPGRITKRKGVFEAVKAMSIVCKNYNASLLLTRSDDSTDKDTVDNLIMLAKELEIEDKIIFSCGMIKQSDMPLLYKVASVVIVPSYYEGLGFTAIEALAARRPTVMANVSGLDEVGKHEYNCLMIPPKNEKELAYAILRLLKEPLLAEKIVRNAKESIVKFDMDVFVDNLECKYVRLIGG